MRQKRILQNSIMMEFSEYTLLSASVCKEIIILIIRNYNYISSFNIKIYTKMFMYSLLKLVQIFDTLHDM